MANGLPAADVRNRLQCTAGLVALYVQKREIHEGGFRGAGRSIWGCGDWQDSVYETGLRECSPRKEENRTDVQNHSSIYKHVSPWE